MKLTTTIVVALTMMNVAFAQNDDGKATEFKFLERVSFYGLNDRYVPDVDTVYYANSGFRVFAGYDTTTIQGETYLVFRYPDFGKGNKQGRIEIHKASISSGALSGNPVHVDVAQHNDLILALPQAKFEQLQRTEKVITQYSLRRGTTKIRSGFMSVPFKFRPKEDTVNFNLTTDVTLGAYIGVRRRIARSGNNFVIIPATLGLSYINVGNNQTSKVNTDDNTSVVPGLTWSSGIVFEINGFNLGYVFGQDYASGVGDNWLYNGKMWHSFSIGYSFFAQSTKN